MSSGALAKEGWRRRTKGTKHFILGFWPSAFRLGSRPSALCPLPYAIDSGRGRVWEVNFSIMPPRSHLFNLSSTSRRFAFFALGSMPFDWAQGLRLYALCPTCPERSRRMLHAINVGRVRVWEVNFSIMSIKFLFQILFLINHTSYIFSSILTTYLIRHGYNFYFCLIFQYIFY